MTMVRPHRPVSLTPLASGFCFGRSPLWFEGLLWFSDTLAESVHTVDVHGAVTTLSLPGHAPFGLGFRPDGSLLIASAATCQILNYDGETVSVTVDLSDVVPSSLGDIVLDGHGRAYVGSQARHDGVIVRVDPDDTVTVVAEGLQFPSGMAITPDRTTLIVAESIGRRLTAFSIASDGGLHDRRTFADGLDGPPDGIAIDVEGAVWTATTLAREFQRVLPGGAIAERIDIGDRAAIACTLGEAESKPSVHSVQSACVLRVVGGFEPGANRRVDRRRPGRRRPGWRRPT